MINKLRELYFKRYFCVDCGKLVVSGVYLLNIILPLYEKYNGAYYKGEGWVCDACVKKRDKEVKY